MLYFITEDHDHKCVRLVTESESLEYIVKYWYEMLKGKELYFDDGWYDQAIIGYSDGNLTLCGNASLHDKDVYWRLITLCKDNEEYYSNVKEKSASFKTDMEALKKEKALEKKKECLKDKYRAMFKLVRAKYKGGNTLQDLELRKQTKAVWQRLYHDTYYWNECDSFDGFSREDVKDKIEFPIF